VDLPLSILPVASYSPCRHILDFVSVSEGTIFGKAVEWDVKVRNGVLLCWWCFWSQ
jgi:hypothetical protein